MSPMVRLVLSLRLKWDMVLMLSFRLSVIAQKDWVKRQLGRCNFELFTEKGYINCVLPLFYNVYTSRCNLEKLSRSLGETSWQSQILYPALKNRLNYPINSRVIWFKPLRESIWLFVCRLCWVLWDEGDDQIPTSSADILWLLNNYIPQDTIQSDT